MRMTISPGALSRSSISASCKFAMDNARLNPSPLPCVVRLCFTRYNCRKTFSRFFAPLTGLALLGQFRAVLPLARAVPRMAGGSRTRLDRVLTHLHHNYSEPVSLPAPADVAALSLSGLHRMFVKHTQTSITGYLSGLRIGDACARLSSTDQPIRHIAEAVGFASLANFNRQFKAQLDMTPRACRDKFRRGGK